LAQAQRAYDAKPSAFTLFQVGAKTPDTKKSIELLEASVKLATDEGRGYEVVRNGLVLIERLILQGNYTQAVSWGEWGLAEFDKRDLKDNLCRLDVLNAWAYARILCGELAGLESILAENISHLEVAYPSLARNFRSTLGDYLIVLNRPHEALKFYKENLVTAPRYQVAAAIHDVTRALLEIGNVDEAIELCRNTPDLLENESPIGAGDVNLAYGMALSLQKPEEAEKYLDIALEKFSSVFTADRYVQSSLYLAFVRYKLGKAEEASRILKLCDESFYTLSASGLKLLAGPEEQFRDIFSLMQNRESVDLELRLFGEGEVWLRNERLAVQPLWLEILAIMCFKERPLGLEELLSFLYGDDGNKDNLKSNLSKMRRVFPISQHPYRLELTHSTDVSKIQTLLADSKTAEALKLYKGSILPYSNSPFIRRMDEVLAEAIRQAVLQSKDSEALFSLLEYDEEDLELLETLSGVMAKSDPRSSVVGAKLKQLHKDYMITESRTGLLA
jgi:tetratricopeptide (TPR) repeat protein